jgi:hypothetical protein
LLIGIEVILRGEILPSTLLDIMIPVFARLYCVSNCLQRYFEKIMLKFLFSTIIYYKKLSSFLYKIAHTSEFIVASSEALKVTN